MKKICMALMFFSLNCIKGISVEADAAAFFPTNHTVRQIFGSVWQNYGLAFDHIHPFTKILKPLSFFGQVNYLFSHGHSEGGNQKTHIQLIPLTFGLKWIQEVHEKIDFYVGAAPRYYFMKIDNNSSYVPQHKNSNGCGAYVTVGSFFHPVCNLMINLFLDYSFMKFKAPSSTSLYTGFSTNVSGLSLGGGIGWIF
jgi:hypothetical protein